MKRILTIAISSMLFSGALFAQKSCPANGTHSDCSTDSVCAKITDKCLHAIGETCPSSKDSEFLPITTDQAEELITKMVIATRAPYVKAREEARILTKFKVETLKRRLLDQALRDSYLDEYRERMDRLERMMMMIILSNSNKNSKLSPSVIAELLGNANKANNPNPSATPATTCEANNLTETQEVVTGQNVASFLSQVFFKISSSKLSDTSKQVLDGVVAWMNDNPSVKLSLKGYASPDGPLKFNNKLSKRRVDAVANYLVSKGVKRSQLEVVKGGIDSVTSTLPEARRVDIKPILCD